MDEENKLEEDTKGKKKQKEIRDKSGFRTKRRIVCKLLLLGLLLVAVLYLLEQFCPVHPLSFLTSRFVLLCDFCRPCVWGTYIGLGVVMGVIIIYCVIRHEFSVQNARLEDPCVVDSMIVEAETVELRLAEPEERPINFEQKVKDLKNEVRRLRKEIGRDEWTEYQVLALYQMLVDFLKVDDLIATARLSLTELEDYAEDSTRRYDWEQCYQWREKIEVAIGKIEDIDGEDPLKKDKAAETLRAELRMLLEHIASYNFSWAEGSAIVRGIIKCGVFLIFPLVVMGLMPVLHPEGNGVLSILNWGLLGVSGAVTTVLLSLRKSDLVEVGNTEGKKELWRAVLSVALGLIAGIIIYSMVAGNLFSGIAFPKISSERQELRDIALSVFWAIAAGYSFERVFESLRGKFEEGNQ